MGDADLPGVHPMPPDKRQGPPTANRGASNAAITCCHSVPPIGLTDEDVEAGAQAATVLARAQTLNGTATIGHAHAVLVMTPTGRWTRRLYLSLHSADKAMARARARGQVVHCIMVELVPVVGGDQ